MKTDAIVDTSVFVDYLRQVPQAQAWFLASTHLSLSITPVVWMEIVQGARSSVERAQSIRFLRQFAIEHPTPDDNHWAMRQLAQFHLSHGVEMADVMIASVAARLSVPLYTLNIKHYQPLPALVVQRPY
ncbi:MAG: PIN domain-containing protein [Anaerolineae bacterium]|nr:PIN domain-containing protein [Anaerolineae bacterium]